MGWRPALLSDRLPGEIDHALRLRQSLQKRLILPGTRIRGIQLQPLHSRIRTLLTTHQSQLMTGLAQHRNQFPADETGAAEKQQAHGAVRETRRG